MDWSQLSLNQTGNSVTGFYVQWGYSLSDPANAGSISGTVSGNVLTGTLDDNENDGAVALSLTLDTNGYLHGTWNGSNPLCGVTTGNPLPAGCGWSDTFTGADADGPITLTQTGQEVVGGYAEGQLAGLVADFRLNGVSHSSNNITGHFSWAWTSFSETAFSGNSLTANGSTYEKWCGAKSGGTPPSACLGGGGLYDGTWLMNLGVLTVRQPLNLTANPVTATGNPTGVWFEYGASSAPEYTLTAPTISVSGLDWTDTSAGSGPGGGVNLLAGYDSAFQCFSMTGTGSDGSLFCGSVYCADANFLFSDFLGVLPSGCGMSNSYYLYRPSHANENPSPSAVVVTEKGPSLYASFEDSSLDIAYGQAEQNVTGTGAWIYFTGFVTDGGAAVNAVFDWYPSIDDTSFAGDQNNNQIAWCGNSSDSIPNPCDQ